MAIIKHHWVRYLRFLCRISRALDRRDVACDPSEINNEDIVITTSYHHISGLHLSIQKNLPSNSTRRDRLEITKRSVDVIFVSGNVTDLTEFKLRTINKYMYIHKSWAHTIQTHPYDEYSCHIHWTQWDLERGRDFAKNTKTATYENELEFNALHCS